MSQARLLTLVAFAMYCGFLGILVAWVPRFDLGGVVLISVILTGYDLFLHRPPSERRRSDP